MGETFTRKIGPLPMWAWTAIVGAVIVGWAWWKKRQSGSSSSQPPAATADASQVPQFVNQTYTTVQPPSAPSPTSGATTGTTTTNTSGEASGVSRVHRSPQVRHQINRIHEEHQDYEQNRTTAKPSGEVHKKTRKPVRRG